MSGQSAPGQPSAPGQQSVWRKHWPAIVIGALVLGLVVVALVLAFA